MTTTIDNVVHVDFGRRKREAAEARPEGTYWTATGLQLMRGNRLITITGGTHMAMAVAVISSTRHPSTCGWPVIHALAAVFAIDHAPATPGWSMHIDDVVAWIRSQE